MTYLGYECVDVHKDIKYAHLGLKLYKLEGVQTRTRAPNLASQKLAHGLQV